MQEAIVVKRPSISGRGDEWYEVELEKYADQLETRNELLKLVCASWQAEAEILQDKLDAVRAIVRNED